MRSSAVLAFLFACATLATAPRATAEDRAEAARAETAIRSQALVGLRAPACELTRLPSASSFVESFEGRVLLVDFWASWCPTCEHAFGFLNELARDFRDEGLEVLAINLDSDSRDARDFLAGRRVEFELARDATGRCPRGFGLIGMPSAYLIDDAGHVRAVTRGFRPGEARALRSEIEALLAKSPNALPAVAAGRAVEESVGKLDGAPASAPRAADSTPPPAP